MMEANVLHDNTSEVDRARARMYLFHDRYLILKAAPRSRVVESLRVPAIWTGHFDGIRNWSKKVTCVNVFGVIAFHSIQFGLGMLILLLVNVAPKTC
jgi:hypothetical protein